MATQAAFLRGYDTGAESADDRRSSERAAGQKPYRLRALPNEDVYFYRKSIDNSRVVRQADPRTGTLCWKYFAQAALVTLLLTGLFWPGVYGLLAGYQLESLKAEHQKLLNERVALQIEQARLLSPERLQELARIQAFIDPAPGQVVYLDPMTNGSLALNVPSR